MTVTQVHVSGFVFGDYQDITVLFVGTVSSRRGRPASLFVLFESVVTSGSVSESRVILLS